MVFKHLHHVLISNAEIPRPRPVRSWVSFREKAPCIAAARGVSAIFGVPGQSKVGVDALKRTDYTTRCVSLIIIIYIIIYPNNHISLSQNKYLVCTTSGHEKNLTPVVSVRDQNVFPTDSPPGPQRGSCFTLVGSWPQSLAQKATFFFAFLWTKQVVFVECFGLNSF